MEKIAIKDDCFLLKTAVNIPPKTMTMVHKKVDKAEMAILMRYHESSTFIMLLNLPETVILGYLQRLEVPLLISE